jgi:hypothetical protein
MAKTFGGGQLNLQRLTVGQETAAVPSAVTVDVVANATNTATVSLYRNQSAATSVIGIRRFDGLNSTPARVTYAAIQSSITANTAGAHVGAVQVQVAKAGTLTTLLSVDGTNGVTINPSTSGNALSVFQNAGATAVTLTNCPLDAVGTANSYVQVDVHNSSNGALASSDFIATADTGTDTTQYIDMGVNSSGFSSAGWTISGPLDTYLYASDGAMTIGTASAQSLSFHTGGTLAANIRLTLNATGDIFGRGISRVVYASSQTAFISNTTLTNTPLVFSSVPAGTYAFKAFLPMVGNVVGTMGAKFKLTVGGTNIGNSFSAAYGVVNNAASTTLAISGIGTQITYTNVSTGNGDYTIYEGSFTTTTAGAVAIQMAQNTSTAQSLILQDRAYLMLTQLS